METAAAPLETETAAVLPSAESFLQDGSLTATLIDYIIIYDSIYVCYLSNVGEEIDNWFELVMKWCKLGRMHFIHSELQPWF